MEQFLEELNAAITEVLTTELEPRVAWLLAAGTAPVEIESAFVSCVTDAVERRLDRGGYLRSAARAAN